MQTTHRTSPSRQPVPATTDNYEDEITINDSDRVDADTPSVVIGHQLCEFCRPHGETSFYPDGVCDCTTIQRRVAGGRSMSPSDDASVRVAEEAILNHWQLQTNTPHDEVTITESLVSGAINGDAIIRVAFNGRLCNNLTESYECDRGTAKIQSFTGNGYVNIRVTLSNESRT